MKWVYIASCLISAFIGYNLFMLAWKPGPAFVWAGGMLFAAVYLLGRL